MAQGIDTGRPGRAHWSVLSAQVVVLRLKPCIGSLRTRRRPFGGATLTSPGGLAGLQPFLAPAGVTEVAGAGWIVLAFQR